MKYLLAIDSFKGCISSVDANDAVNDAIVALDSSAKVVTLPVSDGGEGWLDAFEQCEGGERIYMKAHDPLMRLVDTSYLKIGNKAIIECAKIIGLHLLEPDERNPMKTVSYGLGEVIVRAVKDGCNHIVVGLGGSATNDCGVGMLKALGDAIERLEDEERYLIPENVKFTVATDVAIPLCGPEGASMLFSRQKGATPEMVKWLERRSRRFAMYVANKMGYDYSNEPGAGAAGGLGYAFMQWMDAKIVQGAELLFDTLKFDEIINDVDLIITGEGRADRQTLMGKLPCRILRHAMKKNIPVILLAGQTENIDELQLAGFHKIICINPPGTSVSQAIEKPFAICQLQSTISALIQNRLSDFMP